MKDIPMFTSEYGVASLVLREIPYTAIAYIRLLTTEQPELLLQECIGFCRACGAETFYATGDPWLECFPLHTAVIEMRCDAASLPQTDAALFPVLPETLSKWREIYNEKMKNIPNAAYLSERDATAMLEQGNSYFVHRNGTLLGIGKASGDKIEAVASLQKGAGRDVVLALCSLLTGDTVSLEVAANNEKAVSLYESLGFTATRELSRWYCVGR